MRSEATQLGSCHALSGCKAPYPELDIPQGLEDYRCWTAPRTSETVYKGSEIMGLVLTRPRTCTERLNEAVHCSLKWSCSLTGSGLGSAKYQ